MTFSDILALLALLISAYVAIQTRNASKSQAALTDREVALVRLQLENAQRDERTSKTADVAARLYKVGKNDWRLKIFNRGPSIAENVNCSIEGSDSTLFSASSFADKLPLARMEKGDSVEITAFVHLQSRSKEVVILTWDDSSGVNHTKSVEVTL